ncbi:MAG TPA: hypothetical protein VH796_03045 [Nitrososphaeraceae archaeon]|jgi:hypothetical protein
MEREINNTYKLQCLYRRYKDIIFFNKNIILSGLASLVVGSLITQLYALHYGYTNNFTNSVVSLAAEYSVFFPLFAFLYYRDNKFRYVDSVTGKRKGDIIKTDVKKLIATFSVSEMIYSSSKVIIGYQMLQMAFLAPYQAAVASTMMSWILSAASINIMIKVLKLFKR